MLKWNGDIVVLAGQSHMGIDYGELLRLSHDGKTWKKEHLHALPGCPQVGLILKDGRLFANCAGGAVAISKNGEIEYLGSGKVEPDN